MNPQPTGTEDAPRARLLAADAALCLSRQTNQRRAEAPFISSETITGEGETPRRSPASPRVPTTPSGSRRQRPQEEGGPDGDGDGGERVHPHEDDGALALPDAEQLHNSPCKKPKRRLQSIATDFCLLPFAIANTHKKIAAIEKLARLSARYRLPMFIAGGTAYWRWRMNWYRGSGWMRPRRTAPLTKPVPSRGSRMYLTTTMPAITDG